MTATPEPPSALLRRAADRLDELAGAATEGEWFAHEYIDYDCGFEATVGTGTGQSVDDKSDVVGHGYEGGGAHKLADAAYIAAVHPGVGKAVALLLRTEAASTADDEDHGSCLPETCTTVAAMVAARKILGEA